MGGAVGSLMSDLPEDDAEACIDIQRVGTLLFRREDSRG